MYSVTFRVKVLPDRVEEFEGLVRQLVRDIHENEPGPPIYEVRKSKDDPLSYVYFVSFADEDAYNRYAEADYHTQMSPKAMACLDGDPVAEMLVDF